ncbi:MAG: HgcAB-associated protein [Dehalococcoidales bacterium]|nr:HgcAB-associated protein [Dehalococcoidales bacterium]
MADKSKTSSCCGPGDLFGGGKIEALVNVDERGQMVLPKELRDRANIDPGEKMALMSWEKDGRVCCIFLIKAEELAGMAKSMLGPIFQEIVREGK